MRNKIKIKLNDKTFKCQINYSKKIIYISKGIDNFDLLFFKKWAKQICNPKTGEMGYAKDYFKNIDYVSKGIDFDSETNIFKKEFGVLKGCFIKELNYENNNIVLCYNINEKY